MVRLQRPRRLPTDTRALVLYGLLATGCIAVAIYLLSRPSTSTIAPAYDVVLPQRTPIEKLGGWRRVSPAQNDPVFAYDDTIDDVGIIVSQQPIPESFAGNVAGSVRELAENGSYTTVLEAGGTKVYIGRSARGPQSAVFAKDDVLVFIKTEKTISQTSWIDYINKLVDPESEQLPTF